MKKYIMPFLAALLALTSCYDLDRAHYDQLSSSTFWQNRRSMQVRFNGCLCVLEKYRLIR